MKIAALLLILFVSFSSVAQSRETFDLATFKVPGNWKKISSTPDAVGYAVTNNQKRTFCQVAFYKTINTMGNAQLDFETEWRDLIAKSYSVAAKPEPGMPTTTDGWESRSGVAPFDFNGMKSTAMLVTMSGYGKRMSIVILANTQDYQTDVEQLLESVVLNKPGSTIGQAEEIHPAADALVTSFAFSTTTFDDGWVAVEQTDWVQVTKGNLKLLIHYPNKIADEYNPVVLDGLKNAWNVLVAPRYSSATRFEFKPISDWQTVEFAEADAVERVTGKNVHVVLFKFNHSGGGGKYLEFITPDKNSFEQEFGVYHATTSGWEKLDNMATYNKFAVAASDLTGIWTNDFSGTLSYVNAQTGADAGMSTQASKERFELGPGNSYHWDLGVASGMVGNIKFQSVKSSGTFSVTNWQVAFSDIEGKPRTYNASFSCLKGARLLWLDDKAFGRIK